MVTFVTTEHFTLQGARAATTAESTGRAAMFLGSVSAGLVALGLIATATRIGTAFYAFGLIVLLNWGRAELAAALARGGLAEAPAAALLTAATAVGMVVEVLLWLVVGVGPLLWPIAVAEEAGVGESLRLWLRLLREHRGRLCGHRALHQQ